MWCCGLPWTYTLVALLAHKTNGLIVLLVDLVYLLYYILIRLYKLLLLTFKFYKFMQCNYTKFAIPLKIWLINRRFLSSTFPSLVSVKVSDQQCVDWPLYKYTYCKLHPLMQIIFFSLDNLCNIQCVTAPLSGCGFRHTLCRLPPIVLL